MHPKHIYTFTNIIVIYEYDNCSFGVHFIKYLPQQIFVEKLNLIGASGEWL